MVMKLIRTDYPTVNRWDQWFDQAWNELNPLLNLASNFSRSGFESALDFHEDDDNYYARFELPGFKKNEVQVELENAVLTVSAERQSTSREGSEERHVTFNRSIGLPDGIAAERVKATMEDGVLTITLPRQEARKPRAIKVS